MSDVPEFFVPDATDHEAAYAEHAKRCGSVVAPHGERVYSIEFVHDGITWTATVGKCLHGVREAEMNSRGVVTKPRQNFSDAAKVLAIFNGPPCFLVRTNHGVPVRVSSKWENPFMAGEPRSIAYFPMP